MDVNTRIATNFRDNGLEAPTATGAVYGASAYDMRQVQTLEFRDDASPDYLAMYPRNQILDRITTEPGVVHDIIAFLERPQRIKRIEWADSNEFNENLATIDCSADLIKTNNIFNKISGFRYFKADIEFSIVVNAQPFQQGGLLLWYLPQNGSSLHWSQKQRMAGKTGCLSTVYNLADARTLHMTVPFVNPIQWQDLVNPTDECMGQFYVTVYAPLQSGKAEITVFARYVNVKLAGPTSDKPSTSFTPTAVEVIRNRTLAEYEPQSTEAEEMISSDTITGKGPISTVARAVNDIATVVGSYFKPALVVTKPISWIAAAIGQTASLFGWSKPISVEATAVNQLKNFRYMANFNGLDTSDNLGLDADNQIENAALFATNIDEMQFDNIISIFNWGDSFTWTTGDAVGKVLYNVQVSPMMFSTTSEIKGNVGQTAYDACVTQYLGFVASFFKYWKGDIEIQMRAFKTNYHSGRLRIIWTPGEKAGTAYTDAESMAYSILWNVATDHTTKTIIPYMSRMPWLPVRTWSNIQSKGGYVSNGELSIVVVNPLRATDTVPQNIKINLELAGSRGFAFSVPRDPHLMPVSAQEGAEWSKNNNSIFSAPASFTAQIGDDSGIPENKAYITMTTKNSTLLSGERYTSGEAVVSFRQLIKRFQGFWPTKGQNNWPVTGEVKTVTGNRAKSTSIIRLDPFEFRYGQPLYTRKTQDPLKGNYIVHPRDNLVLISSIYAYARGSMRVKVVPTVPDQPLFVQLDSQMDDPDPVYLSDYVVSATADLAVQPNLQGGVEVQIPYYSRVSHSCNKIVGIDLDNRTNPMRVNIMSPGVLFDTSNAPMFYKAAGDDFSFGFLTGVPSLIYTPANANRFADS